MTQRSTPNLLRAIRRPEYTGENRCRPCTVINLVFAAAITAGAAAVWQPAGIPVALGSLAGIYLRGYLVPGTPALTKRYLPDRVLDLFGKSAADTPMPPAEPTDTFDIVSFLTRTSVVVDDGDDIGLAPEFEVGLKVAALELDSDAALLAGSADLLAVAPEQLSFADGGLSWRVSVDDSIRGKWESRAAFITDLAAHRTLADWTDDWDAVPGAARGRTLSAIRACCDTCPVCWGEIRLGTESVSSCCREYEVVAAVCHDCDARLFETDAAAVGDA